MNSGELKDVKAMNRRQRRDEQARLNRIRKTWSDPDQRAYLWEFMAWAGVNRVPFAGSSNQTNFNCGMQNAGNRILADVQEACPDLYLVAMQEAKQRHQKREEEVNPAPSETPEKEDHDG